MDTLFSKHSGWYVLYSKGLLVLEDLILCLHNKRELSQF